jgi:signal transduction histidine kinase
MRLCALDDPASGEHLVVTLEASPAVANLPADVEVAAFRIALEALVNVQRHAKAHACTIRLTIDGPLHVDVTDDGTGFATDAHAGVGIHSMEVRAAELGGVCTVTCPEGGGTWVHALLPIPSLAYGTAAAPLADARPISRPLGTLGP